MNPNPKARRGRRVGFLLLLFLSVPGMAMAKTKNAVKGGDFDLTGILRPDLVNAPSDPALRFPVMTGGEGFRRHLRVAGHQQQHHSLHRSATHGEVLPLF